MNELIKYFNKNYGKEYGNLEYPRNTIGIYQVYQIIKDLALKDENITKLLEDIKLPKPKNLKEREMYSECINNNNKSGQDSFDLLELERIKKINISSSEFEIGEGILKDISTYKTNMSDGDAKTERFINFDKDVSSLIIGEKLFFSFICTINGEKNIYNFMNKVVSENTGTTPSTSTMNIFKIGDISYKVVTRFYKNRYYNGINSLIEDETKCCLYINYANNIPNEIIDIIDNGELKVSIIDSKVLTKDNEIVYTPTKDYHPTTKKYVDDKYNDINALSNQDDRFVEITPNGTYLEFDEETQGGGYYSWSNIDENILELFNGGGILHIILYDDFFGGGIELNISITYKINCSVNSYFSKTSNINYEVLINGNTIDNKYTTDTEICISKIDYSNENPLLLSPNIKYIYFEKRPFLNNLTRNLPN